MKTVAISGGYDPLHHGHLDLIQSSAKYGKVIIILNSDSWLERKKDFVFLPFEYRRRILLALRDVWDVQAVDDLDGTVCEALERIKPTYFANGGDRTAENTPELQLCLDLGITPLWNVGGGKVASSSELVHAIRKA